MRFKRIYDGARNVVGRVKARHRTDEKSQKDWRKPIKGARKAAARVMREALAS